MKFKGVDTKSALAVIFLYIISAIILRFVFDTTISMMFLGLGMIIAGIIGILNKSYAILHPEIIKMTGGFLQGFMMYMNYLILFLGIFLILNQF
ncbi:MAG: hypothetical protein JXR88_14050 [Clostridia bacterium]|nr:hypothetical protein [Clostridia bacterium]